MLIKVTRPNIQAISPLYWSCPTPSHHDPTTSIFLTPPTCVISSLTGPWEPLGDHGAENRKWKSEKQGSVGRKINKPRDNHSHLPDFTILSWLWPTLSCLTLSFLSCPACSSSIGVFFCGPKALSKTLQRMCCLYSSADPRGVHFYYHRESF